MRFGNIVRYHPILGGGFLAGIIVGLLSPASWGILPRAVGGWDVAATFYVALVWRRMFLATAEDIRARAAIEDESAWIILLIAAAGAAASLFAIVGLLAGFKDLPPASKPYYLSLAVYTIFGSWFFLHTLFTIHYAHAFYGVADDGKASTRPRGGLQFGGKTTTPDLLDFAYFSFTIGMTAQTSDTAATSAEMRRLSLAHAILTFFFNTVLLALTINIAASLL